VAPTTPGRQSWPTREQSACSCDSRLLELASFPAIRVLPPDGSGAMAVKPSAVSASSRDTLAFVYAPAPGGTENGVLTIDVPSSWSAPSTTPTADGYVTSDAGTVAVSGRKITVSALSLAGTNVTIKYGSTAGGGPGALAPSSPGAQTWVAKQKSTAGGTFANLAQAPQTTVYAPDGSGTMTTPTSTVPHGASGKTVSFTYTVAPGGMANGHVKLRVPNGWSAPSTTGADPGFISASAGAVSLDGRTIIVSGLTLAAGQTVTITYGAKGSGGPAANAPGSAVGAQTWEARERSTPPGSSRQLGSSTVIAVT